MARIRTIKPDFFLHEELAALPPLTRLLFIGLWTQADREGRLADRPPRLKAQLFPYERMDVHAELDRLAATGFLIRYAANGAAYLQIPNFTKHQHCHIREPASVLPSYEHGASTVRAPEEHHASRVGREGNGRESKGREQETSLRDVAGVRFIRFWEAYRKKTHRAEALKAWEKLDPTPALQDTILAAVAWQFCQPRWLEAGCQYAPNAATYLNEKRWTDEPPPASTAGLGEKEARNLAAAARFVQAGKRTL